MASQLIKRGGELYGKKKGDDKLGLLAGWAGSGAHAVAQAQGYGRGVIAKVGYQERSAAGKRQGAPKKSWAPTSVASDHTGKGYAEHRTGDWGGNFGEGHHLKSKVPPRVGGKS